MTVAENDWKGAFEALRIPPEYAHYRSLEEDTDILKSLDTWKSHIHVALEDLWRMVLQTRTANDQLTDPLLADIVFHVSPYAIDSEWDGLGLVPWNTWEAQHIALDILSIPQISQPTNTLLRHVLLDNLKPIFASNPHPYINTTSGRKLARPAGGPFASQDYYDEQTWKEYPGIWSVLAWAVRNIPPESYEELWHLLIPPLMTLLDDYQANHKLEGIIIVSIMLRSIPKEILLRTGVDELFFNSFKAALSHLTDPDTPMLLHLAITTWLQLTLKVTEPNSANRFNRLCTLLGNAIIEGIWLYSESNLIAMKATLDALPEIIKTMDVGAVRYLKSLIPQLAHLLATDPQTSLNPTEIFDLQKSASKLLLVIIESCAPRIEPWKFTILDSVARCWVMLVGSGVQIDDALQGVLREIMFRLVSVCPDISQDGYKALLTEDQNMFSGLIPV